MLDAQILFYYLQLCVVVHACVVNLCVRVLVVVVVSELVCYLL